MRKDILTRISACEVLEDRIHFIRFYKLKESLHVVVRSLIPPSIFVLRSNN